ncbi:MAG TPA: nickel-responsive transcriptional regulator NikR [candidate division Zixibacteria bacterium]|nr:nickel-responsive transcriptional regulator NikR [candidate division Zixibacteria bacterium]
MPKIKRAGVTFPPDLLKDFDEIVKTMGYQNRSKAVQDAVRMFVAERKLLQNETKDQAGLMMMVYDHDARGLESALTNVQHHFANIICSSMHIHLSETDCLEAIAVKGNAAEVGELRDQLATKKGVKLFKVMVFSV